MKLNHVQICRMVEGNIVRVSSNYVLSSLHQKFYMCGTTGAWDGLPIAKLTHDVIIMVPLDNGEANQWGDCPPYVCPSTSVIREASYQLIKYGCHTTCNPMAT